MATVGKKLVKSKSGYRMVIADERIASPFIIEEPQWIPDNSCSKCQNIECQVKFDFRTRKHHCRRCGKLFCDRCSKTEVALPRMCFIDPVRHCKLCAIVSKRENEFFDRYLKILTDGGEFRIHTDPNNSTNASDILPGKVFTCALSGDHRHLQFEGDIEEQENIVVQKMRSVQVAGAELDQQGNRIGKGIAIQYTNSLGETMMLKMEVDELSSRKQQSMNWVVAMLKAFKLLQESPSSSSSLLMTTADQCTPTYTQP